MKIFLSISLCTALYFILHMPVYSQNLADLSGWWRLNTGDIIYIQQSGNNVTAVYDPTVQCHSDELRTLFSSPILEFTTMTGRDTSVVLGSEEFYSCTRDKRLIEDCGLTAVYKTKFRAQSSPDGNEITGERFSEGWTYDVKEGKFVNCRKDSKYDKWISFSLKRIK